MDLKSDTSKYWYVTFDDSIRYWSYF